MPHMMPGDSSTLGPRPHGLNSAVATFPTDTTALHLCQRAAPNLSPDPPQRGRPTPDAVRTWLGRGCAHESCSEGAPMSAFPPTPIPVPVVLLASRDEVFARSLETVLTPAGYAVLRAYTARSARDQARRTQPDAVVLATDLEDPTGLELCRQLRADRAVSASTPILLTEPGTATRQSRLEALRAGADQLWSQPMDTEEFALRLAVGVRAKRDADAARAGALVDPRSAFWNEPGLLRGAAEVLAQMARARASLTIAVL